MQSDPRPFNFFNPARGASVRYGNLPHWNQSGATYFITFRTADSVPQPLMRRWQFERRQWLLKYGIDPSNTDWPTQVRNQSATEEAYHKIFTRRMMEYLDQGHGRCDLARPPIAAIVAASLRHFDNARYLLADFVIMPNHVHLLACLLGATQVEQQCRSWKTFSARQINSALGRRGRFWQEESFDHLVRSPAQFKRFQAYIADNPLRAKLHANQYHHYRSGNTDNS